MTFAAPFPADALRWGLAAGLLAFGLAAPLIHTPLAHAEDAVYQRTAAKGAGPAKWTGTITDYTGRELRIQMASTGKERVFPFDQVTRIETTYTPEQLGADKLLAAGKFELAQAQYVQALRVERRTWVRRQILANLVWCQRALGQWGLAARTFQTLVESDPQTFHFDCIPLVWAPVDITAAVERDATTFLDSQQSALDVLIGASLLVSTPNRERAVAKLGELTQHADQRIAWLAQAQLWRASAVTASPEQLANWDASLVKIPAGLGAGPAYVVGAEWARRKQTDKAALRLMQLPILYPRERQLAARALATTGQALERDGKAEEAVGLYREIVSNFAEVKEAVAEAQGRLAALEAR
jgi:tetratricopeptide (TPR) repeat protein